MAKLPFGARTLVFVLLLAGLEIGLDAIISWEEKTARRAILSSLQRCSPA